MTIWFATRNPCTFIYLFIQTFNLFRCAPPRSYRSFGAAVLFILNRCVLVCLVCSIHRRTKMKRRELQEQARGIYYLICKMHWTERRSKWYALHIQYVIRIYEKAKRLRKISLIAFWNHFWNVRKYLHVCGNVSTGIFPFLVNIVQIVLAYNTLCVDVCLCVRFVKTDMIQWNHRWVCFIGLWSGYGQHAPVEWFKIKWLASNKHCISMWTWMLWPTDCSRLVSHVDD